MTVLLGFQDGLDSPIEAKFLQEEFNQAYRKQFIEAFQPGKQLAKKLLKEN